MRKKNISRVDLQVSILTAVIVVISCSFIFSLNYHLSYNDMIDSLQSRVMNIYQYLELRLDKSTFAELDGREDESSLLYIQAKGLLESVKNATGVRYLYTAKRTEDGRFAYLVDGLPSTNDDFRHVGDAIEPEIIVELEKALAGQEVMPSEIKSTSWGYIFISYMPIHCEGNVVGVVGIEFDAAHQYKTFRLLKLATPAVIVAFCLIAGIFAMFFFRRISNPTYKDLANTDMLTGLKNRNAFDVDLHNLDLKELKNSLGILSIDLDCLKTVNDTYGHAAGDQYIQASCGLVQRCLTPKQVFYRIGGDEFVVIFNRNEEATVQKLLEAAAEAPQALGLNHPVGISAGYALFDPSMDSSLYDTLKRADKEMYRRKRESKGQA